MPEDRETHKTTYEDLLMDSIYHMRLAKRTGEEYIFDELLDEIEMLFGLVPELHQAYQPIKQHLEQLANQNMEEIQNEAATIEDDILKRLFKSQKTAMVKWDYRTDMLDAILNLMNDYQLVPFKNPYVSELSLGELDEEMLDEETEEQAPPQQPPQKKLPIKKPLPSK